MYIDIRNHSHIRHLGKEIGLTKWIDSTSFFKCDCWRLSYFHYTFLSKIIRQCPFGIMKRKWNDSASCSVSKPKAAEKSRSYLELFFYLEGLKKKG